MIHDQETRSDSYQFISKPQIVEFRQLKRSITKETSDTSISISKVKDRIQAILEVELSDLLFNIKVDFKGVDKGLKITISGWFETYEEEQTRIDEIEEQITDRFSTKIIH